MEHIGQWFAKQFDNGLTPAGIALALCLMGTGIIGAVAAANSNLWVGIPLLCIFFLLLGALFVAAMKTDPERKISRQEKIDRWKKLPFYVKAGLLIFCVGSLLSAMPNWLMPESFKQFPFMPLGAGISSILAGICIQKNRPPIPVQGAEAITFELAPEQYLKKLRSIVWSSYIAGLMMVVISALYFM